MALFQQKPQVGHGIQYYTLGQNRTVLLVGLGNMGAQYDGTRHNIGFACLEAFVAANNLGPWMDKKDLKCQLASGQVGETRVIAVKPTTFMNLSGEAVQAVAHFYKLAAESVVVVHDELDVPFGQIRTRVGGSAAGHNGIKSVSQHIGEQYGRVRVGIGPKVPEQIDSADFVLARFSDTEQAQLKNLTRETTAIISEYVFGSELPHETRSFIV